MTSGINWQKITEVTTAIARFLVRIHCRFKYVTNLVIFKLD